MPNKFGKDLFSTTATGKPSIFSMKGSPRILVISTYCCLGKHCKIELADANLISLASVASNITHADSVRRLLSSLGPLGFFLVNKS